MALATSGNLSILATSGTDRRIALEVDGNETPNKVLTTLASTASLAANITAFYGYSAVTIPNAPSNAVAVADALSVSLSWNDNSNNEDGFYIYRSVNSGTFNYLTDRLANNTGYDDTNITQLTTYQYAVYAYNTAGLSGAAVSNTVQTPSACLLKNSKIIIDTNFNTKNVQDLKVGDYVYTLHEKTGVFGLYKITKCDVVSVNKWIYIKSLSGKEIKCSDSHLLLIKSKKKKVSHLKSTDKLMYIKDSTNKIFEDNIVKFKIINESTEVYKIEVESAHTYITDNGIIHHNLKIE